MKPRETLLEEEFSFLRNMLLSRAGFVLDVDKKYMAEARLWPVDMRFGLSDFPTLIARLKSGAHPLLEKMVIEALLNGETTFFRDPGFFESVRKVLLPEMMQKRATDRRLRIWSAAASTGQEIYSLAMLLAESFPELEGWDVELFASDLSELHLARAREGRYTQFEVNRGLPSRYLVKYFVEEDGAWILKEDIRRRVTLARFNLIDPWPPVGAYDLILLRNVMIYWDIETKRSVLKRIREAMRPGGYLALGGAESPFYVDESFTPAGENLPCCFTAQAPEMFGLGSTSGREDAKSSDTRILEGLGPLA